MKKIKNFASFFLKKLFNPQLAKCLLSVTSTEKVLIWEPLAPQGTRILLLIVRI